MTAVQKPRTSDLDSIRHSRPARVRNLDGPRGLPLIGQTLKFMSGDTDYGLQMYETYGPVYRASLFGMNFVQAVGPDAADEVLGNRDRAYASGPGWGKLIGPFFNRGLMLLDFEEHLSHRRILQQAFTNDRLAIYLAQMTPVLTSGIDAWTPGPITFYPAIKQVTLDVATRAFMDGTLGPEADRINRSFIDCVRAGTAYVRFPVPGFRWANGLKGRKYLDEYLGAQIPAKRASDGADLFSALCHVRDEDGNGFSDADVLNHMIFLLMAAHDTSTITLTSMAYYMAKHPEWQQRCRDESLALPPGPLQYGDADKLVALEMVFKEAMRLVTPVPGVFRRTVKPTTLLGKEIPANAMVSVTLMLNHVMPQYWTNPEEFDPERFSDARREDKIHRHAFEPFGGGVHKCIGMFFGGLEVKAAMHQMLQSWSWSIPDDYVMPVDHTSLPSPKDGLPLMLKRR